ncbi:MAG: hypothetical protein FWG07_02890 [Treponema sp.]|nr:hypothetical protein [Treponema sp.]
MALKKISGPEALNLSVDFSLTDQMFEDSRNDLERILRSRGWTGKSKRDQDDEIRQGLKNSTASKKRKKGK